MNADEKIKKMEFWMKLFTIVGLIMMVVALSTFVWGETDEDGGLVGLGGDVAVVSLVILVLMFLGFTLIIFMGLCLRVTQYAGGNQLMTADTKKWDEEQQKELERL